MTEMLFSIFGFALVAGFADAPMRRWISRAQSTRLDYAWHYTSHFLWGLAAWLFLSAITTAILSKWIVPGQSVYIFSGSPITLWPNILWGVLIFWVVTGNRDSREGDTKTSTVEGRIGAILDAVIWLIGTGAKLAFWAIGATFLCGIAYALWTGWRRIFEEIPPSGAIIIGAAIIAYAIMHSLRKD